MREYIAILTEAIEDYRMTPEEFIDAGGACVSRAKEGAGEAVGLRS